MARRANYWPSLLRSSSKLTPVKLYPQNDSIDEVVNTVKNALRFILLFYFVMMNVLCLSCRLLFLSQRKCRIWHVVTTGPPQPYRQRQYYVQALTLNPNNADAWNNLGASLDVGDTSHVANQPYTEQQCYGQALTLNPQNAWAWYNGGASLDVGETAQIGSQSYTQQQCYGQAVTLNPKDACAGYNLGASLDVGETEEVASQTYTKQQSYAQAVVLDPNYANAWKNLGTSMDVGETAQIGSQSYTKQQCYLQALTLDPQGEYLSGLRAGPHWVLLSRHSHFIRREASPEAS